ncbi:cytochrome-c oxidase, cbb3-type subunit III [Actibacterium lipolyticum]|uniref:Cbb3-type cytochrome c oxidase subunit n=1 Tax=Actibacterium lipolyticum TaxID=1524263 RepID=A0A238KQK1_9RHOB|nr:cytochrome-c oxidase, cbb3-type subunit III [Actibacterium lipolyticum]SMX45065.1 Cbb3-type cytochrome c oxidase subunit CcoP [Actibacterium lipolyticum]
MSTDKKQPDEVETTGHSWDGIQEYNNPLPRWWLYSFYACIVYALLYMVAYPAWPLVKQATPGLLGYSTRANVAAEIQRFDDMNAPIEAKLVQAELTEISADPDMMNYSVNAGAAVFQTWCAQCHGSGAAGVQASGYPNLLDDDWLWGGAIEDIHLTISHGIRNEQDEDARYSEMPAFGEILEEEEIAQVVQYVRKLSNQDHDAALATSGETVYLDNCAACHMDEGTGDRFQGAPNLTDAIWLYGGSDEAITYTVENARFGVMPNWNTRLSEAEIRAVSTYVHQLGGGE